jgi:Phosphatase-1 catalytic subunit binding region
MTPKVHIMRVWDFASRAYRKEGVCWQTFARDHERFKKRIFEAQETITPILDSKHRDIIFSERFQDS